jgi:hypothetical protein
MMRRQWLIKLGVLAVILGVGLAALQPRIVHSQVVGPLLTTGSTVTFPGGVKVQFGISALVGSNGGTLVVTYPSACTQGVLAVNINPVATTMAGSGSWMASPTNLASMTIQNNNPVSSTFFYNLWCLWALADNGGTLALAVLTGAEAAFAYSAFLPSLMTISQFGSDNTAVYHLRRGEILATAFALILGVATSYVAKDRRPFWFSVAGAVAMLAIYEHAIRTSAGGANRPSGPLLWGLGNPVLRSTDYPSLATALDPGRFFGGGIPLLSWGTHIPEMKWNSMDAICITTLRQVTISRPMVAH